MESIRGYLIQLTAAALFCAIVTRFAHGNSAVGRIIKLLCGIFIAYSIVNPVQQLDLHGLEQITWDIREEAYAAVQRGEKTSLDAWSNSISDGTRAYILEKAKAMNVDLAVEVEVSDDDVPVPFAVTLTGKVAPYAKSVLSDMISQDLNIPKERQIWISE